MEHYFLTPSGKLKARWQEAFPGALAVHPDEIQAIANNAIVFWLDFSSLDVSEHSPNLQEAQGSGRPVVVLSGSPGELEAIQVLERGARGYCHVLSPAVALREIAHVVSHGGVWLPPELLQRLLSLSLRMAPRVGIETDLGVLTARERMVAERVAIGASNREIAEALEISERTVKSHLSSIFEKLAIRDRVQLALAVNRVGPAKTEA